jgi:tetratricopeptide (TPR) repeat protein
MSRSKRKRRKLRQHIRNYKSTYLSVSLIVVSAALIMTLANMLIKEESRYKSTVQRLTGTPEERYQKALAMVVEGNIKQARVVMFNLARLGDSADNPLGYGKAHLWVASDKLTNFEGDFIWKFPGIDKRADSILALPKDEETSTIQLHLAHAVALNPGLEKAITLWAATMISQGERNQAVEILMDAIGNPRHPHPELLVPLIHVLAMEGNDLELRDRSLYAFSELGRTTRYTRKGNITARIMYILNAIILQKYDVADTALQVLEAKFPITGNGNQDIEDPSKALQTRQVRAARVGYYYHQAMLAFKKVDKAGASAYREAADALEQVVALDPDCESAVAALSHIAEMDDGQRERIAGILQKIMSSNDSARVPRAKSQVNISLARLNSGTKEDKLKLLEDAVSSDPDNADAILQLTGVLLAEASPDYPRVEDMVRQALRDCDRTYHPDFYHRLGEVQVHHKNWGDAIVSLEKALAKASAKEEVHQLLATAYEGIGQVNMAKQHQKLATEAAQ